MTHYRFYDHTGHCGIEETHHDMANREDTVAHATARLEGNRRYTVCRIDWGGTAIVVGHNPATFATLRDTLYRMLSATLCGDHTIEDDLAAYGAPSECYAQAYDAFDRNVVAKCEEAGWDLATFVAALETRTSPRWVYFSVFSYLGTIEVPPQRVARAMRPRHPLL